MQIDKMYTKINKHIYFKYKKSTDKYQVNIFHKYQRKRLIQLHLVHNQIKKEYKRIRNNNTLLNRK